MSQAPPRDSDEPDGNLDDISEEQAIDHQQLDTVYGRTTTAQDRMLTEMEPPNTFAMSLRPYQKKGLNWMVQRESSDQYIGADAEKDDNGNIIEPMHPLWQEFEWPEIPKDLESETFEFSVFYANLYSGELSLDFPRQMKMARGGSWRMRWVLVKLFQQWHLFTLAWRNKELRKKNYKRPANKNHHRLTR